MRSQALGSGLKVLFINVIPSTWLGVDVSFGSSCLGSLVCSSEVTWSSWLETSTWGVDSGTGILWGSKIIGDGVTGTGPGAAVGKSTGALRVALGCISSGKRLVSKACWRLLSLLISNSGILASWEAFISSSNLEIALASLLIFSFVLVKR